MLQRKEDNDLVLNLGCFVKIWETSETSLIPERKHSCEFHSQIFPIDMLIAQMQCYIYINNMRADYGIFQELDITFEVTWLICN